MARALIVSEYGIDSGSDNIQITDRLINRELRATIQQLWETGDHADLRLKAQGKVFRTHKWLLLIHSEYFRKIKDFGEKKEVTLDLDPVLVENTLFYLYQGQLEVPTCNIKSLRDCAQYLGINTLVKECNYALLAKEPLEPDYAIAMYLAAEEVGDTALSDEALQMALKYFPMFGHNDFNTMSYKNFRHYILHRDLKVLNEHDRLSACLAWVKVDRDKRAQHLPEMLSSLSLGEMNPQYLRLMLQDPLIARDECRQKIQRALDRQGRLQQPPQLQQQQQVPPSRPQQRSSPPPGTTPPLQPQQPLPKHPTSQNEGAYPSGYEDIDIPCGTDVLNLNTSDIQAKQQPPPLPPLRQQQPPLIEGACPSGFENIDLPCTEDMFNLNRYDLKLHEKLGSGTFGSVMKGVYREGSQLIPVAVKIFKRDEPLCDVSDLMTEALLMAELQHRNILRLVGVCKSEVLMLVMELAALGPLNKYLKSHSDMPMKKVLEIMFQVAEGMAYLESKGIVHRNLAAREVLLVNESFAKISGFQMSKALDHDLEYYKADEAGRWPLKWYAPECIYYFTFNSKSDVWSYGITLWEATSYGAKPYKGMKGAQVLEMIESNKRLEKPEQCPPGVYDVMLRCWRYDKAQRPSFVEIMKLLRKHC